jgi:type III pantothenate kinase
MLLTLDLGNSAVKGGLFEGDELAQVFSVDPPASSSTERRDAYWHDAFAPHLSDVQVDRVGLVSVVPARTEAVSSALQSLTRAPVTSVHPGMDLPFVLDYDTPDTLGTDRLAAAAAGWVHYGRNASRSVLVVDAGTAVNYEVVHRDGIYQGGAIGAGPALVREALRAGTAQLPEVPLTLSETPVGRSTQTALQSGIMGGLVDSVRGMEDRLAQSLPDTPLLVLTGGWSALLGDHLNGDAQHAPHLVLRGAQLLTTMNA